MGDAEFGRGVVGDGTQLALLMLQYVIGELSFDPTLASYLKHQLGRLPIRSSSLSECSVRSSLIFGPRPEVRVQLK